jgi:hypothetical protein
MVEIISLMFLTIRLPIVFGRQTTQATSLTCKRRLKSVAGCGHNSVAPVEVVNNSGTKKVKAESPGAL